MSGFGIVVALLFFAGGVLLVVATAFRLTAEGFFDHDVETSEPTYAAWAWQLVGLAALLFAGAALVAATIP